MFCEKCGKENINGSKFCEHCGAEIHSAQPQYVPPQPQYTPPAEMPPDVAEYAAARKKDTLRKQIKTMLSLSSVLYLISGIFQCLLGVRFETLFFAALSKIDFSFDTVGKHLDKPHYIAFAAVTVSVLITGYVFIMMFIRLRRKKDNITYSKKEIIPHIAFMAVPVLIFILEIILFGYGVITNLKNILLTEHMSNNIIASTGLTYPPVMNNYEIASMVVLILTASTSVAASAVGLAVTVKINRGKDIFAEADLRQTKKNTAAFVTATAAMLLLIGVSTVSHVCYNQGHNAYLKAADKLEDTIRQGHLKGYTGKTIDEALSGDFVFTDYMFYHYKDPWYSASEYPVSYSDNKRYMKTRIMFQTYADDDRKYTAVDLVLCYDESNGEITVDGLKVDNNDVMNSGEGECWLDCIFGDALLHEIGKEYVENGVYVENSDTLYNSPNFKDRSSSTYRYSGTKTVKEYIISDDGKTVWLKLEILKNGQDAYVWFPKTKPQPNND